MYGRRKAIMLQGLGTFYLHIYQMPIGSLLAIQLLAHRSLCTVLALEIACRNLSFSGEVESPLRVHTYAHTSRLITGVRTCLIT
jgi:hypothetical protein